MSLTEPGGSTAGGGTSRSYKVLACINCNGQAHSILYEAVSIAGLPTSKVPTKHQLQLITSPAVRLTDHSLAVFHCETCRDHIVFC